MNYKYTFMPYSCFDQYTTKASTDNISNVIDRMIRVTAKVTERFAGDIMYDIEALIRARGSGKKFDKILLFREDGVNSYKIEGNCLLFAEHKFQSQEDIQVWHLIYNQETGETIFMRVRMKEERVEE